jgi:alkanesulfonate monooxygenase SsuD/methylene tetrahydromethanopterin reductase-like flavin-dependent oxidoreductase (luciferase family)
LKAGIFFSFQNPDGSREDGEAIRTALKMMADPAEDLGYDSIWFSEHHFTGYSVSPNPLQLMTYMAGRTSRIEIGSAVVVLPWHNPVRVAEEVSMLDVLSNGRVRLAIGRGAGRIEFDTFGLDMNESRQLFIESAETLIQGLENGYCEYHGTLIKQSRAQIRPTPTKSFRGRTYAAGASPETIGIMADLGVGMFIVPQKSIDKLKTELGEYRRLFASKHNFASPPPILSGHVFCDEDADRAHGMARKYIGRYWQSVLDHYRFDTGQLEGTKGYEHYLKYKHQIEARGEEAVADEFIELNIWGTPEMCYEKIKTYHEATAADTFLGVFSYAMMPWHEVQRNFDLFTRTVKPEMQKLAARPHRGPEAAH